MRKAIVIAALTLTTGGIAAPAIAALTATAPPAAASTDPGMHYRG
jgi:hypothetical protein